MPRAPKPGPAPKHKDDRRKTVDKRRREALAAVAARYNARLDDPEFQSLPEISPQHAAFVAHFVQHFNAARAAREAGYAPGSSRQEGSRILARPDVQAHVRFAKAQLGELHFELHEQMLHQLREMLGSDITNILDADGNLLDPQQWPDNEKLMVAGIDIEERMVGEGDAQEMVRTKKVKLESRLSVIDRIAKLTGRYIDKQQLIGKNGEPVDPVAAQPIFHVTFDRGPADGQTDPAKRAAKGAGRKRQSKL